MVYPASKDHTNDLCSFGGNIMKKLLLAGILFVGSSVAEPAPAETRGFKDLAADLKTNLIDQQPCDVPTICDSPSPLARGLCFLKGLGAGTLCIGCLALLISRSVPQLLSFSDGNLAIRNRLISVFGTALATGGSLQLGRESAKNFKVAFS